MPINDDPVYLIWHRVRSPFVVPSKCHKCQMDDWEVFDVDKAGCRICGRFHRCYDGGECPGSIDGDHQACEITGCWIRARNFQQGYTDTAMPVSGGFSSVSCGSLVCYRPWIESDHIVRWLHTLIFSETAKGLFFFGFFSYFFL